VTDQRGRKRQYGEPNAGFERYPGQGERPVYRQRGEREIIRYPLILMLALCGPPYAVAAQDEIKQAELDKNGRPCTRHNPGRTSWARAPIYDSCIDNLSVGWKCHDYPCRHERHVYRRQYD
jgi:hypothetical protein